MKQLFKEVQDSFIDPDTKRVKKRLTFSIIIGSLGFAVLIWFLYRILYVEGYWNSKNNINLSQSSLIGEFIGGFSGTLFTLVGVILLFETLVLQRKELKESRSVFSKQHFENTFFNLLNLYGQITKSLVYSDPASSDSSKFTGKEYFQKNREIFYEKFQTQSSFTNARKILKINYIEFYSSNKETIAHYFRTIYRIFKYINESELSNIEKMKYAKIVRAQLTDSELFFIYYNSFSIDGINFRNLILEFNILKHLSQLDKVEFKKYVNYFTPIEKNAVETLLSEIKQMFEDAIKNNKKVDKSYLQGSHNVSISSNLEKKMHFIVTINNQLPRNLNFQKGIGIEKLNSEELKLFYYDFIYDLFYYSNYYRTSSKPKIDIKQTSQNHKEIFDYQFKI